MQRRKPAARRRLACAALAALWAALGGPMARAGEQEKPRPAVIHAAEFDTLQAALDAVPPTGGLVRLPPGNVELAQPLVVTTPETRLAGAGAATHLVNRNEEGQPALILRHKDYAENRRQRLWRVQLADFRISGNPKSGDGVLAQGINEIYIHGLSVDHNGGGIELRDAWGCAVSANTFTINTRRGLVIGPKSGRIAVTGNSFSNTYIGDGKLRRPKPGQDAAHGILLDGTTDITITGNVFSGLSAEGIKATGECTRIVNTANVFVDLSRAAPGKHKAVDLGGNQATGGCNIIQEPKAGTSPSAK